MIESETNYNLFKDLFFRNLSESRSGLQKNKTQSFFYDLEQPHTKIDYKINNYGFRGEDFNEAAEIITLGCSQTFGMGLPQSYICPEVFSNMVNKTCHNLAYGGDSVQSQVFKAFKYFEEIGNPKIIVGFLPCLRMELPFIRNVFGDHLSRTHQNKKENYIQQIFFKQGWQPAKYSKFPHNPVAVLSSEVSIFYSFMFIQMLEQYCKTANIILMWSLYDDRDFIDFVKTHAEKTLTNYVNKDDFYYNIETECLFNNEHHKNLFLTCHQENKDIFNNPLYAHAADCNHKGKNRTLGHYGIHTHLHVADMFYKEYLKRMEK